MGSKPDASPRRHRATQATSSVGSRMDYTARPPKVGEAAVIAQGGRIGRQDRVMSTPNAVATVSVPGTVPGIRQAMLAFEQFGRTHGLPAGAEWRVLLALDEILSNVVRYGDAGG